VVRDLLTGTLTEASALNTTYFEPTLSSITTGSLGNGTWTVVWSDNASDTLLTACVLTSPSYDATRTNFMKLSVGTGVGHLNVSVGTGQTAGELTNPTYVPNMTGDVAAANIFGDYVSNRNFFISCSTHSLVMNNMGAATYWAANEAIFVAVDMVADQHARFVNEGSMKIGYVTHDTAVLNVPNFYNARTDVSSETTQTVTNYNVHGLYSSVGLSKKVNLQDNINLIIPLVFSKLEQGWFGENVSTVTNLFLTTSTTFANGELVTIDSTKFFAINPTANKTPANTPRYLIKE